MTGTSRLSSTPTWGHHGHRSPRLRGPAGRPEWPGQYCPRAANSGLSRRAAQCHLRHGHNPRDASGRKKAAPPQMASATQQNNTRAMNRRRRTRRRTASNVRRSAADHEPLLEDCWVRAPRIGSSHPAVWKPSSDTEPAALNTWTYTRPVACSISTATPPPDAARVGEPRPGASPCHAATATQGR
jgi:hypothetical protein